MTFGMRTAFSTTMTFRARRACGARTSFGVKIALA